MVLLETTPANMEPLTFTIVLPISITGSIAINRPTKPTGRPIAERTVRPAKVAPPPTPAIPKEANVVTIISWIRKAGSNGLIPTAGAIITATIAGYTPAQPFCPILAPSDADKFAWDFATPNFSVCASIFIGIAAADDLELKANIKVEPAFLK